VVVVEPRHGELPLISRAAWSGSPSTHDVKHAIWLVLVICNLAAAAPQPTLIELEVDLTGMDTLGLWRHLQQAVDEPGGVAVDSDPMWTKLGLKPGDVIRSENGRPVGDRILLGPGPLLLEITRNGKPVLMRLMLRGKDHHRTKLTDDEFDEVVERTKQGPLATPLRAHGQPSGVRVIDDMLFIRVSLQVGDVVRTIDGTPIFTDGDFVAALQGLRVGTTEIQLDRDGRRETVVITREAKVDFTHIRKRSDAAFDVPAATRDALKRDFQLFTRHVRFVPVASNGKVHGVKLLDITAGGLYDALGLRNDDVILDVDGRSIDSFEDAISTHTALEPADKITVHLVRRGKPFAIVYSVIAN
jgi:C-terminal processing protease CtpA/Prc